MGLVDNMVHSESNKVSSLSSNVNGEANVLHNGTAASVGRFKFKRRKVYAVRDFPPGCGTLAMRLRSNGNAQVDEQQPRNDVGVGVSVQVNVVEPEAIKDGSDELMFAQRDGNLPENSSDRNMAEPVDVQPLRMILPDDNHENSICASSVSKDLALASASASASASVGLSTKQLHEGEVVVRDLPPKTGSDSLNCGDTVKVNLSSGKNLVLEKSGSADASTTQNMVRDMVVYKDEQSLGRAHLGQSLAKNITMDVPEPLKRKTLTASFPKPIHVAGGKKAKKGVALHAPVKLTKAIKPEYGEGSRTKNTVRNSSSIDPDIEDSSDQGIARQPQILQVGIPPSRPNGGSGTIEREYGEGSRTKNSMRNSFSREMVSLDIEHSSDQEIARQSHTFEVGIPPSHPNGSSSGDSMRNKVKETLRLFHGACRKILQEQEAKPKKKGDRKIRVDFEAAKLLKAKGLYLNTSKQIIGPVPGLEVGAEFQYRMELNVLGIHRPSQGGIDCMKDSDDELIATSIVASGGYDDELDNSDVLIYTGQGGNVMKVNKKGKEVKEPEDQQLITGNLALANSYNKKNPVRVIRGNKNAALESSSDAKGRTYVYDGLYVVEDYWQETGTHGKLVFRFKLRRMPGQPELSWKVVKKSKKLEYREGLCKLDISEGKERLPISAVNEIDDEKPPMFIYTVKMIYPDWCRPIPPKACGCTTRCTEARNCACVAKNGGEIPYNYDGAVVGAKNLIYECGPLCRCPPSCYLRATQRGIKFQLEIFKTASRGWGVRSLNSIPSGSFICEYVGELLEDKEAERRTGNDEYLFDIGNKYDNSLAEGMSNLMPGTGAGPAIEEDESSGFTIDAARKGNIGRFINHSCSPNLYAQNVLYDHEDTRIPHVMFIAMDNIPPLEELSYHYNYMIDQVRDANGNIRKKICHCGASDCTGRLY